MGYLWIGTGEGLSVFDSKQFHNYYTTDGLSSNSITSISADKKNPGSVWIGTDQNGVDLFRNGKFLHFGQYLPLRMKIINSVYADYNDDVFCGTDSGFYMIRNNNVKLTTALKIGSVYCFAQTSSDKVLIGASKGLFIFNPGTGKIESVNLPNLKHGSILSMITDKDKIIFASSSNGKIYRISSDGIKYYNLNFAPRTIAEDEIGNLWLGATDGLYKLNKNFSSRSSLTKFTSDNGLIENNISALYRDRENILWIGTNDNGISKLTYPNLIRFKIPKKYSTASWSSSACDVNGHFWISLAGYAMEVWMDKDESWHNFIHPLKKYYSRNYAYFYCANSNKLIVTNPSGLIFIYDIIQKNPLSDTPSQMILREKINLSNKYKFYVIYQTLEDANGYLWCSALDLGVIVLDNTAKRNVVKIYSKADGLPDNSVREIYQDQQGNIWLGGYDGGLSMFSHGKILSDILKERSSEKNYIIHFSTANGLPDNGVRSIIENDLNEIIIGTRYGGIAIYNNGKISTVTKTNGLISNAIWSMTKSAKGNVWLGTQSGIQELDENNKPTYKLFEGLPKVPYYSICSAADGDLCFANQSDIYIYQPLKIIDSKIGLPIYINRLLINGQQSKVENNLTLDNGQNTITFEFLGILNRQQKDLIYKYRLLGISKNWSELTNKNSVTYAALRPGMYSFQVMAMSGKYLVSEHPAVINFIIQSPFYFQLWFIMLMIVSAVIIIFFISRIRIKRQLEIEKLRNKIAADLHDEIGSGLTKIAILSENALRETLANYQPNGDGQTDPEKLFKNKSLERVGKISRALVDSMIDVIWSIDPKYDSLQDFVSNFKTYAYEVCEAKNIKLIVETSGIQNVKANAQTKRSLQLITKEALNNALKYSECHTFKISLSIINKSINLILEDDGIGFDINASSKGRGLFNISKHVRELNGSFNINSDKDGGTKLIIKFPVLK